MAYVFGLMLALICSITAFQTPIYHSRAAHKANTLLSMSVDAKHGLAILTLPLFLGLPFPSSSIAAETRTNPEAIDIRRIDQQPTQAPVPAKKKTVTLESGVQYYDAVDGTGATAEEGLSYLTGSPLPFLSFLFSISRDTLLRQSR